MFDHDLALVLKEWMCGTTLLFLRCFQDGISQLGLFGSYKQSGLSAVKSVARKITVTKHGEEKGEQFLGEKQTAPGDSTTE